MLNEKEILEELRMEIAFIRRDIIERLRRIEEYITFIDSDINRLRLDVQRINEKIKEISSEKEELIEKVEKVDKGIEKPIEKRKAITIQQKERKKDLNPTEIAIIKYLIENPGTRSATPIAQSIGKAREHVARTLKKLAEEKLIIRDESTWPYTYIVPDDVKKMILEK
jgi:DNA-binding transcriptional ArsR family regulator